MSLPHVYRVTKYDPADRAPNGTYRGPLGTDGDDGPVDAAYLAAVAAFAEESGIERFTVRDPELGGGFGSLDPERAVDRTGPLGPFPDGLDGFYDGAPVTVPVALELVRGMNGDGGLWCRLEAEDAMTVHVGWDQYVYVGVRTPCPAAVARTHELGLFAEPIRASPYDPAPDAEYELRPADDGFWERVRASAARGEAGLVEENPAANASRWHPIGDGSRLDAVRAGLAQAGEAVRMARALRRHRRAARRAARGVPAGVRVGGRGRPDLQWLDRRGRPRGAGAGPRGCPGRGPAAGLRRRPQAPVHRRGAGPGRGGAGPVGAVAERFARQAPAACRAAVVRGLG